MMGSVISKALLPSNYFFNPHALPLFLSAFLMAVLGIRALAASRSRTNRYFAAICLSVIVWLVFTALGYLVPKDEKIAAFWFTLDWVGVSFISISFYAFSVSFLGLHRRKSALIGYLVASGFALVILAGNPFLAGVKRFSWGFFPQWHLWRGLPFFAFFFGYMGAAFYVLFRGYRKAQSATKRNQIKYVLLAFLIAYTGSVDYLATFGVRVYPFGFLPILALSVIIAYAIQRHRLLDITLATRDSLIYMIATVMLTIPFVALIFAVRSPWLLSGLFLVGFLVALRWHERLRNWLQPWIDRWVFQGQYEYLKDLTGLSGAVSHLYSVEQLLDALRTDSCTVYLWDAEAQGFRLKGQVGLDPQVVKRAEFPKVLAPHDPLVRWAERTRGPRLKEEVAREWTALPYEVIAKELELLQAQVVLPLYAARQLRGVLTLGPKRSGAMYNQKDLALLENLAQDAERLVSYTSLVYEHAMRTAKIAHDARQPFQPIQTWLSALRTGKVTPDRVPEVVGKIEHNVAFIHEFFTDLLELNALMVQRLQGQRQFAPLDMGKLLKEVTEGLRPRAAPAVTLTLELVGEVPQVWGHERGLRRAFNNLVVNALKFTQRGQVQVRVKPVNHELVEIQVQDTGPGIPTAELPKLFEPFAQTPEGKRLGEGLGLGLAVIKEVVTLHRGQLRVESQVGKGTTFIVSLPTVESGFATAYQRRAM